MNISVEARGTGIGRTGSEWPYAIGVVAACMIALGVIFREEVVVAFRVWATNETYNHCFLIIPIALYMIWQRRAVLACVAPKPDIRALLAVPLLSLAWFAASVFNVMEGRQFVVMTIVQATLFGVLGWPVYRRLMAPFLYLYFLVPSGEFLTPSLQDFTARFAVYGLELFGIPVYSDGTIIDVPAGTFVVAEACAGLRFLVAAIAFGVFYATEIYESRIRRTIFIALSIVVPVIANGLRALGLIAGAEVFGSAASVEADHLTFGWVFFSLVLIALIFIGRIFSDRDRARASRAPEPVLDMGRPNMRAVALAGMLAVGLAAVGPAVGAAFDASPTTVALRAAAPSVSLPWRPMNVETPVWKPIVIRADREFSDSFTDGTDRVDRFVALYAPHGRDNNLIHSQNRIADLDVWAISGRHRGIAHIGGHEVRVNTVELAAGQRRRLVWYFYALGETNAVTIYDVKWHQVRTYLTSNGCLSALVAVSVDLAGNADPAATLDRYLSAMQPLPPYLCNGQAAGAQGRLSANSGEK